MALCFYPCCCLSLGLDPRLKRCPRQEQRLLPDPTENYFQALLVDKGPLLRIPRFASWRESLEKRKGHLVPEGDVLAIRGVLIRITAGVTGVQIEAGLPRSIRIPQVRP